MKIIGYGICGPGEAKRYMRATLDEFKRLCDHTIILGNNITQDERDLVAEYGFDLVEDNREWGRYQWAIKEAFVNKHVRALNPDFCVCLDMDEVFCGHITKEWIETCELDAYHVFVVDLWNDENHYKPASCFWNVRLWRWNGDTKWKKKPVHCGLAPEWTYKYHRHAPFLLKHYGLMAREDRERKIKRYEIYDPTAQHLGREYYNMLKSDTSVPFIAKKVCDKIEDEVKTYNQRKPSMSQPKKKMRYAYVKNPHGVVLDIPEYTLSETLARPGFTFVEWADDAQKEMEELFSDVDVQTDDKNHKEVAPPEQILEDAPAPAVTSKKSKAKKK